MLVAHATWHGGALCLWAERTGPYEPSPDVHPFATRDFTGTSYEPLVRTGFRVELSMTLPTRGDHPLPSAELGPEPVRDEPELRPWRVPALVLEPFPAMALLQAAEHAADVVPGTDLRFLCLLADEAVHLAGRGHVLPALLREDGDLVARWRPVIDDPARFRDLVRAMPAACRAADGGRPAAEVLREALSGLVDTAVRGVVPHPLLVSRRKEPDRLPLAERWVMALTGPSAAVAREPRDDPSDLMAELDAWAAAARRPSGPLRVCFRLAEPGAEEFGTPDPFGEPEGAGEAAAREEPDGDSWRVEFALQGTDDPSLYVPAALVWDGEATSVPDAEETLLGGLGRALRLFPDMAPALDGPAPSELVLDTAGAFRFLRRAAPMLAAAGFGVLLPQWAGKAKLGMKLTTRTDDPEASSGAAAPSGFDLKGMVDFRWDLAIGDETVDEAELEELARLKTPLVRLRGQWVELDERQLEAALDFLRHPRRGRMTAAEAIRAIVHAGDDALPLTEVDAGGPLGDLLSGEADRRLTPMRTPEELDAELRPYQERGLSWLAFMDGLGLGALLADDMGLGKTILVLSLLVHERERGARPGPTLAILPMSLVGNWQREAAKFTPKLRVHVHHGTGRHRGDGLVEAVAGADLVLTTYGTAARDAEALAAVEWGRVICDEAQALKNSGTRQARAVRSIPARTRIALTGTPVENHLTELWSIMEFANPGLLGPRAEFRRRFAIPIEREGDEQAALALKRATQPFILRRLKTDRSIISDLPEKQEIKVYCNLTTEQASLYRATVDDMLQQIAEADDKQRRGLVLATMAKLKQVCNHPAQLLKDGSRLPGRSGKLQRLEEICAEVLEQGEKALVFTQYAEFGSMLQPYLAARLERPVLWLHGGTSKQARDDLVQRFQDDPEPAVFLLSLKAAGTGLTLTAANHVVHVDRWWNPAVEDQATDRAFRIGQTRNVQVRKFICVGTMEERVDEMIERKKALAESIVGTGEDWLTELSVAELRDVLRLSPEAVSD
ncbi:Superfamily II DNA or RNA helicase, SNF2 family [Actinomadura meyerae]|uniref:Superfamily II DNA or RNA helicase, SNF2 family n=1 Tax=Actinomadura meyerae TaxID=240840 RepID=A0A239E943_9ACTN|nr:DEAD/DEAH box helicase [Actinomadura meyerae]SNS41137.1 Superfamily II DNA or RNA helicase, SNF2 family [Actinomadura meyerae]